MGKRIVEITQTALDDMEGIYDYIADVLLAAENAMGQYNRIADAILTLESNPEMSGFRGRAGTILENAQNGN